MCKEKYCLGTEIRCNECSQVLGKFDDVPTNVIWYSHLREKLGGRCPKCAHRLPSTSKFAEKLKIEIKYNMPIITK